jgi:hypothetical protein
VHCIHAFRQSLSERLDHGRHIGASKEAAPVDRSFTPDVRGVDVHHFHRRDAEAGTLQDEALHGDVVQVDALHPGGRLHLAEAPGAVR